MPDRFVDLAIYVKSERDSARLREDIAALGKTMSDEIDWPIGPPQLIDGIDTIEGEPEESEDVYEARKQRALALQSNAPKIHWPIGPPRGVPQSSIIPERRMATPPVRIHVVGLGVRLHDGRIAAEPVPVEIDRREYAAVRELCDRVAQFAAVKGLTFEVDFDGESIGAITPDGIDEWVRKGLLEEWERALRQR